MPNPDLSTTVREFIEHLAKAPPPDWVREMIEHYQRTGSFRPSDLRRLLGDPKEGVNVAAERGLEAALASAVQKGE